MKTVGELTWTPVIPGNAKGPHRAILWGDPATGPAGSLFRFPPGFQAGAHSHDADYHAVVISGGPGSYWMQKGKEVHDDSCDPGAECLLMITTTGPASYIPAGPPVEGGYKVQGRRSAQAVVWSRAEAAPTPARLDRSTCRQGVPGGPAPSPFGGTDSFPLSI